MFANIEEISLKFPYFDRQSLYFDEELTLDIFNGNFNGLNLNDSFVHLNLARYYKYITCDEKNAELYTYHLFKSRDMGNEYAHSIIIYNMVNNKRYNDAITYIKIYNKIKLNNNSLINIAYAYYNLHEYEVALNCLDKVNDYFLQNNNDHLYLSYSSCHIKLTNYNTSLEYLFKMNEINYYSVVFCYCELKDIDNAVKYYHILLDKNNLKYNKILFKIFPLSLQLKQSDSGLIIPYLIHINRHDLVEKYQNIDDERIIEIINEICQTIN